VRRSIVIFWGDNGKNDVKARWWHLSKKYVHVSVVLWDGATAIHVSPGSVEDLKVFKNTTNFDDLFDALKKLREVGATELISVQSYIVAHKVKTIGWYSCHSMCKDLAKLPVGFCVNPLQMLYKLIKFNGAGYSILRHEKLWEQQ
jgi:hypothetical protein